MADSDEFEETVQALIDNVLSQRKLWEQRRLEAEQQVKSLDSKLAAYQTTLKDYWESIDKVKSMEK